MVTHRMPASQVSPAASRSTVVLSTFHETRPTMPERIHAAHRPLMSSLRGDDSHDEVSVEVAWLACQISWVAC